MKNIAAVPPRSIPLGEKVRVVGLNEFMDHQAWLVKTDQPPRFDGYGLLVWVKWESTRQLEEVYKKYVQPLSIKTKRVRRSPRQSLIEERKRIWASNGYDYRPSEQADDYVPEKKKKKKRAPKKKAQPPRKRCFHKGGKMVLISDSGEYLVPQDSLRTDDNSMDCGEKENAESSCRKTQDQDYCYESDKSEDLPEPDLRAEDDLWDDYKDKDSTNSVLLEQEMQGTPSRPTASNDHEPQPPEIPRIVTPHSHNNDVESCTMAGSITTNSQVSKKKRKCRLLAPFFADQKRDSASLKKRPPPAVHECDGGSSPDPENKDSPPNQEMDFEAMGAKIARAIAGGGGESHAAESQDTGTVSKDTDYEEMGAKIGREIARALLELKTTKATSSKRVVFVDLCDSDED